MKLSSMRYQTSSTFTEFKRNKEKTENEVNDKDISRQQLDNEILSSFSSEICPLFDKLNHFQASDVHWFSELGTAQGKKEETGKAEEEGKGKGKDAENHDIKHTGKNEVENEVKEDGKDDCKNEGKV